MMRQVKRALALGVALAAVAAGTAQAQDKKITVMLWGTTWQGVVQKASEDFTKKTGVKIEFVGQTTSGEGLTKLQAMKAHPSVDVWFTTDSVAVRAVKDTDMFAPLPAAKMPNLSDVPDNAKRERWVGFYGYPVGIVYRTDMVNPPITAWEDLWNPRFKGKLGVPAPSSYQGRVILIASLLAGGSIDNIEPGLQKLKALKDNVVFWYTSDAQARQSLAQGEISVLIGPTQALRVPREAGVPVTMISPKPTPMMFDVMTLVKAGHEDLAAEFIDFLLSPEIQGRVSDVLLAAPTNHKAGMSDIIKAAQPKPGDGVTFDEDKVNQYFSSWNDRFNAEVAK
ncbi:MAG TPA: extracellular solute-binding protein [Candidatus Sulfotelmatobacter sp.]|nr:extracellular solute-binding protein [Candidatus Sulfotelmatobacter sp.]